MKFAFRKAFCPVGPCVSGFAPNDQEVGPEVSWKRPPSSRIASLLSRGTSCNGQAQRFEQVLQILLLENYASAEARLACFAASKSLAQIVSQYGTRTTLTLSSSGASGRRAPVRPPAETAQQLAALSGNVALVLNNTILAPSACLYPSLTTLSLHNTYFSSPELAQLQLHRLPHLHTLRLSSCKPLAALSKTSISALSKVSLIKSSASAPPESYPASNTITTLECYQCEQFTTQLIMMMLGMVDQTHLQTIGTDDTGVTDVLTRLPALRKLRLVPASTPVGDHTLQQLLQHPGLTHVQLGHVNLKQSFANSPCRWEHLELVDSAVDAHTLSHLPLAATPTCTVHHSLRIENSHSYNLNLDLNVEAALHNMATCARLVFQPTPGVRWRGDRNFSLDLLYSRNPRQAAELITAAMRHLAPGGALEIKNGAVQSPEVRAALQATPGSVPELVFSHMMHRLPQVSGHEGVLVHVPAHVQRVSLVMHALEGAFYIEPWIEVLFLFLRGVRRALSLSLVHCDYKLGRKPVLESPWPYSMQQRVLNWIRACTSNEIKVEFRCLV